MRTVHGRIASSWKRGDDWLSLDVTIPVGSTARVWVPGIGLKPPRVTEGGRVVWSEGRFRSGVPGIETGREAEDAIQVQVGSGTYSFRLTRE